MGSRKSRSRSSRRKRGGVKILREAFEGMQGLASGVGNVATRATSAATETMSNLGKGIRKLAGTGEDEEKKAQKIIPMNRHRVRHPLHRHHHSQHRDSKKVNHMGMQKPMSHSMSRKQMGGKSKRRRTKRRRQAGGGG